MRPQVHDASDQVESRPLLVETFEAIGFEVVDEDSYDRIAEYAEMNGERSLIHRGTVSLHGRCWKLGGGLEIWSILYENNGDIYYADCRPAFRSRYPRRMNPWELVEYDEDGEAILQGSVSGAELVLELQNLTAANPRVFREPNLPVALAGLAYTANVQPAAPHRFEPVEENAAGMEESCENDYFVCGRILTWRDIKNPVTGKEIVWVHVDTGAISLEVLVNRRALRGRLRIGATLCAKVWLQGHVLGQEDLAARYEGVDRDYLVADFWPTLRRGN
jgi:hypothetical protein